MTKDELKQAIDIIEQFSDLPPKQRVRLCECGKVHAGECDARS